MLFFTLRVLARLSASAPVRFPASEIPGGPFRSKCLAKSYKQRANPRALQSATVPLDIPNIPSAESSARARRDQGLRAGEHVHGVVFQERVEVRAGERWVAR